MTRTQYTSEDRHANPKESLRSPLDNAVNNIRQRLADLSPKMAGNSHLSYPLDSGMEMEFGGIMTTPGP